MPSRGVCLCVCVCVCHVRGLIVSKHINIASKFCHSRVATPLLFFRAKRHSSILTGTPITGASNASGVGRNHDSEPISGLSACVNAALGQVL